MEVVAGQSRADIAYFNDRFMPLDQVAISPLDRGFIFGDGVYEVIPSYGGHFLGLERHLERLSSSLSFTRITDPLSRAEWRRMLGDLIARNGAGDWAVYLQITRGVAPRDHRFPDVAPTLFAMCKRIPDIDRGALDRGLSTILLEDSRWQHCHAKTTSLIANVLLRQQAQDAGTDEAILHRDGRITEGAASNVFVVIEDVVLTPPIGAELLPGITRALVIELCRELGIGVQETPISVSELRRAQEVWLTSSTRELVPVTRVDTATVGSGVPGPLWRRIHEAYQAVKARIRRGEPVVA